MYEVNIKYPKLSVDGRKVIVQHSEKDSELWSVEDSEFSAKVVAKELGVHFLIYDIVEKALKASILTIYDSLVSNSVSKALVDESIVDFFRVGLNGELFFDANCKGENSSEGDFRNEDFSSIEKELNISIAAIKGYIQIILELRRKEIPDDVVKMLDIVNYNSDKLTRIYNDIVLNNNTSI